MNSRALFSIVLALILTAGLPSLASVHARPSSDGPGVWHVLVGGQSENKAIQGEAFYPGVITIDAGDTVVWTLNSDEPHTVTFFGTEPLSPECAAASDFAPCPVPLPSSYDGASFAGSGIMIPAGFNWDNSFPLPHGNTTFTLIFGRPGVYVYQSVVQTGMQGVVIVQPNGSPYPFTQADYSKQAREQLRSDLVAGVHAVASFKAPEDTPGPSGTLTHFVAVGINAPETTTAILSRPDGSDAGTVSLSLVVSSTSSTLTVDVRLFGLDAGTVHSAQLNYGVCSGTAAVSPFLLQPFPLNQISVGPDGSGESITTIVTPASGNGVQNIRIQSAGWFVSVGQSSEADSGTLACGNVAFHNVAIERFLPTKPQVNVGDTVVWEALTVNEVHFVLFPAGQPVPPFPDSVAVPPTGNMTSYDGNSFFTSGGLPAPASFVLTFIHPGTFRYIDPIESQLGMQGTIIVRSNPLRK